MQLNPPALWTRYSATIAIVVGVVAVSLRYSSSFYNPEWFLMPAALVLITWWFGQGCGWLAFFLCGATAQYYFIPPLHSWRVTLEDLPFLIAFLLCMGVSSWAVNVRLRMEQRLRLANEALLEKERMTGELRDVHLEIARLMRIAAMSEMAASIAHEVNQPLAAIVANVDACEAWLNVQPPNLEQARSAAAGAVRGATRASEVVSRIRGAMTKTEGKQALIDVNRIVEDMIALDAYRYPNRSFAVTTNLTTVPAIMLDEVKVQQVLLNLLSNAMEATSNTGRAPRIQVSSAVRQGTVHLSVSDNGHGVAPDQLPKLFHPFYTTKQGGVGIGLSVSRSLIEAHGGQMWVEVNSLHGITFHFSLPIADGVSS